MKKMAWIKKEGVESLAGEEFRGKWAAGLVCAEEVADSDDLSQSVLGPVRHLSEIADMRWFLRARGCGGRPPVFRAAPLLCLVSLGGCLSGGYDADFRKSATRYTQDSEFQRLNPEPHRLENDRLSLRIPRLFQSTDEKGAKERSKPPFLADFPGLCIAFEAMLDAADAKLPVVLSVGVLTDGNAVLDTIKSKILGQVRKDPTFANEAWTANVQPAGVQTSWSVLKLRGPQFFEREIAGNTERKSTEGETQVWVACDPEKQVAAVLVWRVPQEVAATVALEELAELVVRTVEFKAAAEPVAPAVGQEAEK